MRFLAAAGMVMLLSGIGAYYAVGQAALFSTANLMLGAGLLVAAGVIEARRFRGFSGSLARNVALRWGAVLGATFGLVVLANVLAFRSSLTLDLTVARQYTLSEQSLSLCAELAEAGPAGTVELLLFEDALLADDVRLLVAAYRAACPIEARELNSADAPPPAAALLQTYDTTLVVCRAQRCEHVGYPSEQNITSAMLRLVGGSEGPVIYFDVGHGEADLASERDHGFSALTSALRNEGMRLRAFVGAASLDVPDDAAVLVLASPERGLLLAELDALERYLQRGGRLLVLLEPRARTNLGELLERWGFSLPDAVLVDRQSSPLLEEAQPLALVVNRFGSSHPVTRKMSSRTMVLLPTTRPVLAVRKPQPDDDLAELVYTSRRAWAESDVEAALAGREIRPDPGELAGGELPIAAAGRYPRPDGEARIVVIGDRDFASNRWIRSLYNLDLLMNAVLWLAEQDARVAIRPKVWTPDTQPLPLETTLSYFYSLALALPELLLLLGIHAWYRQRS
jgi:hypothetical protein